MGDSMLGIEEYDDAGVVIGRYVQSASDQQKTNRIDFIPPPTTKNIWQHTLDIFLPAGYPHSVTNDYLEYQIYDSLQAFSSSIAGLLASRAALSSVGVGDSTASPTAALLLSVLQESAGRVATIIFAHRFGSSLEPECKMYRLLADILNDLGFVLDCLSPAFPKPIRVVILSFSSVLRALCGVAAGSAKASLSAHFARWGNLGELNAKDSSQETVISLVGMLVGSLVVSWVTEPIATWTTLAILLSVHLETNRRAVRAVSMRTLNRQRATLVYYHLRHGQVPTPEEVSSQERIFERSGVLRSSDDRILARCTIGAPVSRLLSMLALRKSLPTSSRIAKDALSKLVSSFTHRSYILLPQPRKVVVLVKQGAQTPEILTAWWQALDLVTKHSASMEEAKDFDDIAPSLVMSGKDASDLLGRHRSDLESAGWDLDTNALETGSATRIKFLN